MRAGNLEAGPRARVVDQIAALVCREDSGHRVRVAIDGVTASGKSTLARELTAAVSARERSALHLSMDGFHHPRAHRHRRGRLSAKGYYLDAYDFEALARHVLTPLGPGGDGRYRPRIIDLASDESVDEPSAQAPEGCVAVIDGTFLQRPEIRDLWDVSIFVDTSLPEARRRGVLRDAEALGGREQAEELFEARYHAAARIYLAEVDPRASASLVIQNDDVAHPCLIAGSDARNPGNTG